MNFMREKKVESYYDILQVSRDCSTKDLKEAFVKLSKECHPDTTKNSDTGHAKFIQISEAYSVLSKNRKEYDEYLKSMETEARFGGDRKKQENFEHWESRGYKQGQNPRTYGAFYNYPNNSNNYRYSTPPPPKYSFNPFMKKQAMVGCAVIIALGIVLNVVAASNVSNYREFHSRKKTEINSILSAHSKRLFEEHGDATLDKLLSKEIKHMTASEAEAIYDKRHNRDK